MQNLMENESEMSRLKKIPSLTRFRELSVETMGQEMKELLENIGLSSRNAEIMSRMVSKSTKQPILDWDKIDPINENQITDYSSLSADFKDPAILSKVAVLKLNGGLGTTMGCTGPKSLIEVYSEKSFLDLMVMQIEAINKKYQTDVPLILMNSFNTDEDTKKGIIKYKGHKITIKTFLQKKFPRIKKESLLPVPTSANSPIEEWYPPGHGDVYDSLLESGLLNQLLEQGKEILFISNGDNLGATLNAKIANYFHQKNLDFLIEVTPKTAADIKGGTLVNYNNHLTLLEIAQVPKSHISDFQSVFKFKTFNTNNIWVNLKVLKEKIEKQPLDLDIIQNHKELNGTRVIQFETAVGSAIKHFEKTTALNVPRTRFLPVKTTSDLLLVQSNLFTINHGKLKPNPDSLYLGFPQIKLMQHFQYISDYNDRFQTIPDIKELRHFTVSGNVFFGSGVILKGTVIIVADEKGRIDIPSGSLLENKVITGNLRITNY
ncbi:utp--glucose-1-phosphate uridylyltransferase [Anaeramoeba ignava]|uniref:UTP--glucose-1-phosphate uridylyltransferase n=1 Tax=Anaeramoeba ignava TaxID=1746090 RepID=A0A9Q0L7V2_ANAIG|nr:utp--glucose-1-phosphate uridylyltransferase [Anaeramoeba ignava]|eukprot:Anaeramoba_ignava/c17214_g1_i2.p1 GENE.c17214_g1_i2~~c17214_g1_i2.p1  ORF type:complete len:490 (+),score=153.17 c17214_g1_i2:1-1470(+)